MKRLKNLNILIFLIFASLILSSCSKNDSQGSGTSLNWTINGTSVISKNFRAQKMAALQTVIIMGTSNTNTNIQFSLMNCDTTGTYIAKLISIEPNSAYVYLEANGITYDSDYCKEGEMVTVKVTNLSSSNIQGHFNGALRSADSDSTLINIAGSFNLELLQRP